MVHKRQFTPDATVKGSGMAVADFFWTTVRRAAKGEEKSATQATIPKIPITLVRTPRERMDFVHAIDKQTVTTSAMPNK